MLQLKVAYRHGGVLLSALVKLDSDRCVQIHCPDVDILVACLVAGSSRCSGLRRFTARRLQGVVVVSGRAGREWRGDAASQGRTAAREHAAELQERRREDELAEGAREEGQPQSE